MRFIVLLPVLLLHTVRAAEPVPKPLEISIGQGWEDAKSVIARAKLQATPFPYAAFTLDDNEAHCYLIDDGMVLITYVSPTSKSIVSMSCCMIPEPMLRRGNFVEKALSKLSIDSDELFTLQFKRDLRTPKERQKDTDEVQRILKEQDEKASKLESNGK